jgi:hypothetical protein
MTVKKLIEALSKFPLDYGVTITDGFSCVSYALDDAEIFPLKEDDGTMSIDIGVGGCRI